MEGKILTPEQVAERLQVHPFTVLKFIRQGKLRASKLGRVYRIRENDLTLFLNEQEANKTKLKKGKVEKITNTPEGSAEAGKQERTDEKDKLSKLSKSEKQNEEIDRSTVKGVDHYILES